MDSLSITLIYHYIIIKSIIDFNSSLEQFLSQSLPIDVLLDVDENVFPRCYPLNFQTALPHHPSISQLQHLLPASYILYTGSCTVRRTGTLHHHRIMLPALLRGSRCCYTYASIVLDQPQRTSQGSIIHSSKLGSTTLC